MAKYTKEIIETENSKLIYRVNDETNERKLVANIEMGDKPSIKYYIDNFIVDEISIENRSNFPKGVSDLGVITSVMDKINKQLKKLQKPITEFIISDKKATTIKYSGKSKECFKVIFNSNDIESLQNKYNLYKRIASNNLNISTQQLLHEKAPSIFTEEQKSINLSKKVFMDNLREGIKKDLTVEDVQKLGDFYIEASTKFVRKDVKEKLLVDLQDKTKIIALESLMNEYKELLEEEPAENKWQKFFEKYITILDSRYIKVLDKNNISTYTTKKPDLILLDLYKFIDLYELKKTNTNLLEYDNSHKNYYWHKDIAMVIAQAEKYVRKMTENSSTLIREIKEDSGLVVDIVKPKAIIVAGHSKYLNNDNKINDFKLLRESLKDITFILYDEFYKQLKNFYNQLKKED